MATPYRLVLTAYFLALIVTLKVAAMPTRTIPVLPHAALTLVLLTGSAYAGDNASPAGHYFLTGLREVGSELRLSADGQFEYMLAYGAYDEHAQGTWTLKDGKVLLSTPASSAKAAYKLIKSERVPEPLLTIQVVTADGQSLPGINVFLDVGETEPWQGYTQPYGYRIEWNQALAPKAVGLAASMYGQKPQWIDALNREHNTFVFELDPGGLGKREFRDTPFSWDGSTLTEVREGTTMRYVRK